MTAPQPTRQPTARKYSSPAMHHALSQFLQSWWSSQVEFRTKAQLARAAGLGPMSITDYFRGKRAPTGNRYERLRRIVPSLPKFTAGGKPFPAWAEELETEVIAHVARLAVAPD